MHKRHPWSWIHTLYSRVAASKIHFLSARWISDIARAITHGDDSIAFPRLADLIHLRVAYRLAGFVIDLDPPMIALTSGSLRPSDVLLLMLGHDSFDSRAEPVAAVSVRFV